MMTSKPSETDTGMPFYFCVLLLVGSIVKACWTAMWKMQSRMSPMSLLHLNLNISGFGY
jgi:hypothetical protein